MPPQRSHTSPFCTHRHNNTLIRRDTTVRPVVFLMLLSIWIPSLTQQQYIICSDAFQISTSISITNTSPSSSSCRWTTTDVTPKLSNISTTARMERRRRSRSRITLLRQQQQSSSSSTIVNDKIKVNGSSSLSSSLTNNKKILSPPPKIPFIIERIPTNPSSALYQEIAQMCITAFFNTDNNSSTQQQQNNKYKKIPIWKEWQLAYLRTLQAGDLERRRKREPIKNRMFIARQVLPVLSTKSPLPRQKLQRPLVLDTSLIRNLDTTMRTPEGEVMDYMYGDIIGFVEVTQRPYGLGEEGIMVERYVLTNLSVDCMARQSGVGTALVNVCEQTIYNEYCRDYQNGDTGSNGWNMSNNNNINSSGNAATRKAANLVVIPDMVLEVEDDNDNAINFYRKRQYQDICVDPTSRRYDLSGLWLQQIRCKRLVMKKDLRKSANSSPTNSIVNNMENTMTMGLQALQRFRDNLLNVQ